MMTRLTQSAHSLALAFTLLVAAMIHIPFPIQAQEATPGQSAAVVADTLTHSLTASVKEARAGETVSLIWTAKLEPTWHIYYQNPGDSGLAPTLTVEGEGMETGAITFPTPKRIDIDPITNYGYEDEVLFVTEFTLPRGMAPGSVIIPVKLEYLYCSDICLPGTVTVDLPLVIAQDAAVLNDAYGALLVKAQAAMPKVWPVEASASVSALEGGMALRFTLPDGSVPTVASFIPAAEELILDNAPQQYEDGTILLAKDPSTPALPAVLKGLLIADGVGYALPELPVQQGGGVVAPAGGSNGAGSNQQGMMEGGPVVLFVAMGSAFLAGLILNLMPCVLPILAIKVLSAVRYQSRKARETHAVGYTMGVLLAFWALALVIIGLSSAGMALGWGFHLQNPYFVAGLTALMVGLGLNFLGVFTVGESATRLAEKPKAEEKRHAFVAAIGTGILAVVVSTPCTVPFMGGAMAFALNQSWPVTLAVFTCMGLGLALPFVVLTTLPATAKFLPKPGLWMVTLKQLLAWPLFVTAVWLAYVFANQTEVHQLFTLLSALLALAFTLWFYGKKPDYRRRALIVLVLLAGAMALGQSERDAQKPAAWQAWSKEAETTARGSGPVFVDFTADWCITCKVVEATVLNKDDMQAVFAQHQVTLLQGDWTKQDPAITEELAKFGRKGVPLYLLYLPGKEAVVLPQFPTQDGITALLEGR